MWWYLRFKELPGLIISQKLYVRTSGNRVTLGGSIPKKLIPVLSAPKE